MHAKSRLAGFMLQNNGPQPLFVVPLFHILLESGYKSLHPFLGSGKVAPGMRESTHNNTNSLNMNSSMITIIINRYSNNNKKNNNSNNDDKKRY